LKGVSASARRAAAWAEKVLAVCSPPLVMSVAMWRKKMMMMMKAAGRWEML